MAIEQIEISGIQTAATAYPPLQRILRNTFFGFVVFALCYGALFYFFTFHEGDTGAPVYIRASKEMIWIAVLLLLFAEGAKGSRLRTVLLQPYNLLLQIFCAWIIVIKLIGLFNLDGFGPMQMVLKNTILYALQIPALCSLDPVNKKQIRKKTSFIFIGIALAQLAFAAVLFITFPDHALWKDDPYTGFNPLVGFFANPNRFGLFLNIAAALLCGILVISNARRAALAAVGILLLSLGIFYTAALSQMIVYFILLAYAAILICLKKRWRATRIVAVMTASVLLISFIGLDFKSPLPDPTHREASLAWDLRNLADLAFHGKTLDGEPFHFTSNSFTNRVDEIAALLQSFGLRSSWLSEVNREHISVPLKTSWMQRIAGRPEHLAPASQSQFAYIYFRYGLIGLALFMGILFVPALRGLMSIERLISDSRAFGYHLALIAFIVTFIGDNGLLDYPTDFILFFLLFANSDWIESSYDAAS